MDEIKSYLLRLTFAAIICGIGTALVKDKQIPGSFLKLLTGAIMSLTLLGPLLNFQPGDLLTSVGSFSDAADEAVSVGKNAASQAWSDGIKTSAESYILDKASLYDASITVEVTVSGGQMPVPAGVRISGRISPYGKKMLKEEIAQNLGISEEDQVWTE